jgi:hypothetical protein
MALGLSREMEDMCRELRLILGDDSDMNDDSAERLQSMLKWRRD